MMMVVKSCLLKLLINILYPPAISSRILANTGKVLVKKCKISHTKKEPTERKRHSSACLFGNRPHLSPTIAQGPSKPPVSQGCWTLK